jgi:hypothetical protein
LHPAASYPSLLWINGGANRSALSAISGRQNSHSSGVKIQIFRFTLFSVSLIVVYRAVVLWIQLDRVSWYTLDRELGLVMVLLVCL